jgi:hypothetical protein
MDYNSHLESVSLILRHIYADTGLTYQNVTLVIVGLRVISFTSLCMSIIGFLYGPPRYQIDTTVLAPKTEFEVTNMGLLYWVLGIDIIFNGNSIKLSQEVVGHRILEWLQLNDSHPMLLPIAFNTRIIKEESVVEFEEHRLYQSIIGSAMYLVKCTRTDLTYPVSYLLQFLTDLFQVVPYGFQTSTMVHYRYQVFKTDLSLFRCIGNWS